MNNGKPILPAVATPIQPPNGPRSERLKFGCPKFLLLILRILKIVNGVGQMRAGKGLRLQKADAGWLLEATAQSESDLPLVWVRVCLVSGGTKTQIWGKTHMEFYADNSGTPGAKIDPPWGTA